MSIKEFADQVCQYVQNALPQELEGAEVYAADLDVGEGEMRTVLLIARPWNHTATGFCLDDQYQKYVAGDMSAEGIAAEIINDRRLYNVSI